MKQDRPSFSVYKAHLYRQYFGRSLSAKPITSKRGENYAILKSTPYKLFLIIFIPLIFIITLTQGVQFGFIPWLAGLGLYFIVAIIRYFFASFVKLEDSESLEDSEFFEYSAFISYEMCDDASKEERPKFSAYLKYIFVPTRRRYIQLIKDADGREYYPNQRQYRPVNILLGLSGYSAARVGLTMGTVFVISLCLMTGVLILLLSPLSVYYLSFKRIYNQETDGLEIDDQGNIVLHEEESLLYKIVCGIFVAAGAAVFILGLVFILNNSFEHKEINFSQPQTIVQDYDYVAEYASERFENTDLIDFHIKYDDINAMQSGEPSSWFITFQNTPGFLPRPNETMEFGDDDKHIDLYQRTYEAIRPTYDAGLITDPSEILAILISNGIISSDSDISSIIITTADYSLFEIHNSEECLVEIDMGGQESMQYIVNIKDKTASLE